MARKRAEAAETPRKTYKVAYPPGLNLRAEPSKDAEILRVMRYMENVEPDTEREAPDGWMAVKGGYCMTEFLK